MVHIHSFGCKVARTQALVQACRCCSRCRMHWHPVLTLHERAQGLKNPSLVKDKTMAAQHAAE